jgi:ribonuclease HI
VKGLIEYYIDGSTKNQTIGVGLVKVNEYGFIEKHHFTAEHVNPTSNIAEAFSLEKAFELIKNYDINKNELIDIYTDSQTLYHSLNYNLQTEFNKSDFFTKQELNKYFQHIRSLYIELISKSSSTPIYHCSKTNQARPLIKVFFKDDLDNKKYLEDAHVLSRYYLKTKQVKPKLVKLELKAIREKDKWIIVKNNQDVVAENKRPLIALSEALKQIDVRHKQIKLCEKLETILKSTDKSRLTNESMKSAIEVIENHKLLIAR